MPIYVEDIFTSAVLQDKLNKYPFARIVSASMNWENLNMSPYLKDALEV